MTRRPHSHPCTDCQTPVACEGALERNHDGFPAVICSRYHLPSGLNLDVVCAACDRIRDQQAVADAVEAA